MKKFLLRKLEAGLNRAERHGFAGSNFTLA